MDILGKIKSAIVRGRINMTDHADEELANDEILDEEQDIFQIRIDG